MLRARLTKTTSTLALAAATVALLAGCGGGAQAGPTPTPTPTWSCTPDASDEPCTPERAAAQQEETEAYAEAMHAYREFTKERVRLLRDDEDATTSPVLQQHATGRYLEVMQADIHDASEQGMRIDGEVLITDLGLRSFSPTELTFFACEDARKVRVLDQNGRELSRGSVGAQLMTAEALGGEWKVSDAELTEERTCPSAD